MAGLFDGLNKAVSKLQGLGEKAVDGAKELFEKTPPELREGLDKVADGAKELAGKAVDGAKELYEKTSPELREGLDKVADGARALRDKLETPAAPEAPKDLHAQIEEEVREKLAAWRNAATTGSDPIHDYIQGLGKKAEEAPAEPEAPSEPETPAEPERDETTPEIPPESAAPASSLDELAEQARLAVEKARDAADELPGLLGDQAESLSQKVLETARRAGAALDDIPKHLSDFLAQADATPETPAPEAPEDAPEEPAPEAETPDDADPESDKPDAL